MSLSENFINTRLKRRLYERESDSDSNRGSNMSSPVPSSSETTTSSSSASVASDSEPDVVVSVPCSTKCSLCNNTFNIPKVLSCFHTFCQGCLENICSGSDKVTCPACSLDTFLDIAGVAGLTPDFAVMNVLESNNSESTKKEVQCTGCKGKQGSAVAKCFDCANYLCCSCVQAHRLMHCFAGHRIINLSDIHTHASAEEKTINCSRHPAEILRFYCRTCDVPICKECITLEHSRGGHDYDYLNDSAQREALVFQKLGQEVRVKAADLRGSSKNMEHSANRVQSQYQSAQSEIEETYKFYISMLQERKAEALRELDSAYNTKQVYLSTVAQKMQDTVKQLQQCGEFLDKVVKNASKSELLFYKKMLASKLPSLLAFTPDITLNSVDLEFVSNYQAIQAAVRNTFGYVRQSSDPEPNKPNPISRPNDFASMNGFNTMTSANSFMTEPPVMNGGSTLSNGFTGSMSPHLSNGLSHSNSNLFDRSSNSLFSSEKFASNSSLTTMTSVPDSLYSGNNVYEPWSSAGTVDIFQTGDIFSTAADPVMDLTSKLISANIYPPKSQIKRQKMIYHCKFGEFGVSDGQFTEPSGVAVNAQNDIIVADTNNHRIQIFDKEGRFKFQFGECGKREGQLLYPNRVAVVKKSGDIVVTERSPTHQVQVYNQYGHFIRKFGANILQHPRGVAIDNKDRIIIVECKVMRVIIFDQMGNVLNKFSCSKYLEFPNGVVVNDNEEIFISDNRAHCVKVFNYQGAFLRQIGGEGITNYPIGVGISPSGEVLIADNHNNFNLTVFTQDGQLINALESKVKHAQCFDVALMDDGSIVLASKDYRLYVYRYSNPPVLGGY